MSDDLNAPTQSEMIRTIHQRVEDMHRVLFGNHKPGLTARMNRAETKLAIILTGPAIVVSTWAVIKWIKR